MNELTTFPAESHDPLPACLTRGSTRFGWIYCIRDDRAGVVKIGFSVNPDRRLKQLQTANASTLRLIAAIYSTADFEALLHWSNKSRRLHGEWFDDADGSISSVLALAAQREDDEICIVGEA